MKREFLCTRLEDEMVNPTDGTKVAPRGMFYMEGPGGCDPELDREPWS